MAMVRTIQHPGVQIQETQIGSYSNSVVLNNTAYIMGFTDRGPIYDYSWIMNKSDFTKIYGQPQTEAEKYLFTAVQSVLANGGTPIVARIPYDNKQCQAYKAIKFVWAKKQYFDIKDQDAAKNPIIPLSALTTELSGGKSFYNIFVSGGLSGHITSGGIEFGKTVQEQVKLEQLGPSALLTMLNPIKHQEIPSSQILSSLISSYIRQGFQNWGFEINEVAPSSLAISESVISAELASAALTGGNEGYNFNRNKLLSSSAISGNYYKEVQIPSGTIIENVIITSGIISGTISATISDVLGQNYNFIESQQSKFSKVNLKLGNNKSIVCEGNIIKIERGDLELSSQDIVEIGNITIISGLELISSQVKRFPGVLDSGYTLLYNFNYDDFARLASGGVFKINDYQLADLDYANEHPEVICNDKTKDFIKYLRDIYNDAAFFGKRQKDITKLQANLLNTTQMGYKNGIYLNASECQISNDQYDDLVTVNQFKDADRSTSKYGSNIQDANFLIVDKQKTVSTGTDGNIGYFTTIIDPFDGLKVQRLLVNPKTSVSTAYANVKASDYSTKLSYWAAKSYNSWNDIYDELIDSMDTLQRVRTADGLYIGEDSTSGNIANSWVTPLYGQYYADSVSKTLMKKFPSIPMADINSDEIEDENYAPSIIDHDYSSHILVAVCNTYVDQATGKIGVNILETFFGSLFNQTNAQTGRTLFIGDIINSNSEYIEFYKNTYIASEQSAYDPPEYQRDQISQIFLKDSEELKNAATLRGIDWDDYYTLSASYSEEAYLSALTDYQNALASSLIYIIDKKDTCIYNIHWTSEFSSFSKKESKKIIANTTGLTSEAEGTTVNVAKNFIVDIDRCINFIKNRDDVPLTFVCDAGLTTIAQFCDNVYWNPNKKYKYRDSYGNICETSAGGWVTQPFNPDDDPNSEDRYITSYADIATWRKVAEKIISICSETRKDCFAIIDAPRQLTLDGAAQKIRRSKFDNDFDNTIGKCLRYITGFNTSYAAGYYNWLRTTDQYTGKSFWIPPTSKIIGNYCYLNISNLPWLAPAGLTYGVITGCHAISHNPNYQEEDQIYMKSWNYIKQYPAEGFVVEGQRTLLAKESVFERINVRLLFLDLERFAYNVSRTFKYQVNNTYTREQFVATLKPKFEDYTLRGGIYEYLIKVDSQNNTPQTIDQNQLRGDIFIKPARLIEYVLLNFVGTTTGTDFNQLPMG